jgi:hypothetical protein
VTKNNQLQNEVNEKSAKLSKTEASLADKVKSLKDLQKSQVSKLKELCAWCEKHLQLNNFKEVKFADNDLDSGSDSENASATETGSLKMIEAMRELKHSLRQSKCIIATKFNKIKEKNEHLQGELGKVIKIKDDIYEDFKQVKTGVQQSEHEI